MGRGCEEAMPVIGASNSGKISASGNYYILCESYVGMARISTGNRGAIPSFFRIFPGEGGPAVSAPDR